MNCKFITVFAAVCIGPTKNSNISKNKMALSRPRRAGIYWFVTLLCLLGIMFSVWDSTTRRIRPSAGTTSGPCSWLKGTWPSDGTQRKYGNYSGLYLLPPSSLRLKCIRNVNFLQKISFFNMLLDSFRKDLIHKVSIVNRTIERHFGKLNILSGMEEDYLIRLSELPETKGIFLEWTDDVGITEKGLWDSRQDTVNLLPDLHYYPWLGAENICVHIKSKEFDRHRWDTIFNHTCQTVVSEETLSEISMDLYMLNSVELMYPYYWPNKGKSFPPQFYTDVPHHVTYLHIIRGGLATARGAVYIGDQKIVPFTCVPSLSPTFGKTKRDAPVYHEVFSISQFYGYAFFHKNLEEFPRLAPYLDFLQMNPGIKVQVYQNDTYTWEFLDLLGISPSRVVSGDVRAEVLYLPRSTTCGYSLIQETQLLSHIIRQKILTLPGYTQTRNKLIVIRRQFHRYLLHKEQIEDAIRSLAIEFGLDFYLFPDNPPPTLQETMVAFHQAVMVVAPHGAGLSNLMFADPGTYVIEVLCNPPHTNMVYTRIMHILGHHYHALLARDGCARWLNINVTTVVNTTRRYLEVINQKRHT